MDQEGLGSHEKLKEKTAWELNSANKVNFKSLGIVAINGLFPPDLLISSHNIC